MFSTAYHELQRRDNPFNYKPSLAGNVIFLILFFICTASHSAKMVHRRCWYFSALVFGGALETVGYVARIAARHNPSSTTTFVIQALFLLISPACFAATIYMTLGRIIRLLDCEHATPIRSTRITKIFVSGDILSFIAQGAGGGLMASSNSSSQKTGKTIILIGLAIQIVWFGAFVIISGIVHRRINKEPSQRSQNVNWKMHLKVLYTVSVLIFIRCIFRVVEFAQGFHGWLISHEWTLFTFDSALMVLVLVVMYFMHPSSLLGKKDDNLDASAVSLSDRV